MVRVRAMTLALLFAAALVWQEPLAKLTQGPLRGASDSTSMDFWARASLPGEYTLDLCTHDELSDVFPTPQVSTATAENDLTLHWRIEGLKAGKDYLGIRIRHSGTEVWVDHAAVFRTSAGDSSPKASLIFGSCCEEKTRPLQPIWNAIQLCAPDAVVLLGDTPYIESTDLEVQRKSYREFFEFEALRSTLYRTACYFTWDDHDYAWNDQFGLVKGRENSRRAFLEYHASQQLGVGDEGIFQSFRRGPVEVFLLDTRWFADIEESLLAPGKRSLLGAKQIAWLQQGLAASTAEFKLLACGMVWNDAVRPNKKDCFGNWLDERDALLRWIGEKKISGVVLVGGDIHRSRVILHPFKALAGYDVPELISSPLAQSVIEAAKVDAPGLLFDVGAAASFLLVAASRENSGAQLRAHIVDGAGKELFARTFSLAELSPAPGK